MTRWGAAQALDLYSEDGLDRPFFCTLATPWSGNIVKITNTGPVEFPLTASIVRPCWRGRFRHPEAALERKRVSCVCEHMRTDAVRRLGEGILKCKWRLRDQQWEPYPIGADLSAEPELLRVDAAWQDVC